MKYRRAQDILVELIELTCKGGGLLLNISPMGDGSIPAEQQAILRAIGAWMARNGDGGDPFAGRRPEQG